MATNQDVFHELQNIKSAILGKGGTITQANTNVSLPELTAGVNSIPTGGGGGYAIIAAELPNVDIALYEGDTLLHSVNTGASGGKVDFSVLGEGEYTIKASNASGTELWTQTITIDKIGVYLCKTGKPLNNYTLAEISTASNGGYAKYMWSAGDYKDLASFMGQTSSTYTRAIILDFDRDNKADGSGKVGITFKLPYTSSTYTHAATSDANINGVSWLGSLVRQNCLRSGESAYVFNPAVTSATSGTYYTFNPTTQEFTPVTLPGAFVSGTKYYTIATAASDGAFFAGLPSELVPLIKQVTKKTWSGYGGSVTSSALATNDNTIVETKDWLFLLADGEVFGNDERYTTAYSKYALEGEQYEYYKAYKENKLRFAQSTWLRSPDPTGSTNFAYWSNNGYVNNSNANSAARVALCFCL